jgi:hypothetical protein
MRTKAASVYRNFQAKSDVMSSHFRPEYCNEPSQTSKSSFPSWSWASPHAALSNICMIPQPKMTLSKSIAFVGNATIDRSLAKDGKLKIHGLCRYAKVDDVKSWRCSKDQAGWELTFSDPSGL